MMTSGSQLCRVVITQGASRAYRHPFCAHCLRNFYADRRRGSTATKARQERRHRCLHGHRMSQAEPATTAESGTFAIQRSLQVRQMCVPTRAEGQAGDLLHQGALSATGRATTGRAETASRQHGAPIEISWWHHLLHQGAMPTARRVRTGMRVRGGRAPAARGHSRALEKSSWGKLCRARISV